MGQEELKTCLGALLLDLRGNWAYDYSERLYEALELCNLIEEDTTDIESNVKAELEYGDYDGRIFRDCNFYGYKSEEGMTTAVKEWCELNLSHPEYNSPFESKTS